MMLMIVKLIRALLKEKRYTTCDRITKRIFKDKKKPYLSNVWVNITRRIPADAFEPPVELVFENEIFTAPRGYDTYLRIAYGDYMTLPPEEKRGGGHGDLIVDLNHAWTPGTPISAEDGRLLE